MRSNNVLYFVFAAIFFTSCGSAKIISPQSGDFKNSPLDIVVEHTGCGTLHVFLDYNKPNEREVTSLLQYRNGQYVAEKVAVPLGTHEINAFLEKNPGERCCTSGQSWKFEVVEAKTCISGKVVFQGQCFVDPLLTTVRVYKIDSNEIIATGKTDGNGNFCIEFVPRAEKVDVVVSNEMWTACMGYLKLENIEMPGSIDLSCIKNNCKMLGEISVPVGPGK